MTWMDCFKSLIRHFLAVQLRKTVRRRTAAALSRLDDRLLADIGIPRDRISDYAREVAHMSVPVPPMPTSANKSITERLRSWRKRRASIRELSRLDDRLLQDIGIEPGRVDDVVDAVVNQRGEPVASHPVVQLSDAIQEILVPARRRSRVLAAQVSELHSPIDSGNRATIGAERTPDAHALRARVANESLAPQRRRSASVGI